MKQIAKNRKLYGIAALALGLCLALGMGFMQFRERNTALPAIAQEESISNTERFRTEREQLRAMQKAQLNDILHADGTNAEIVTLAQRQLLDMCRREELELILESLLSMRGFQDPVATVHGDSVNILIRAELITRQESALIMDMVCREAGVQSGNVKIIPIK